MGGSCPAENGEAVLTARYSIDIEQNNKNSHLRGGCFFLWNTDAGIQRLDNEMDVCSDAGMLVAESSNDPAADHAAVFVIGIGQHDDVLRYTALGNGIAPAEV